MRVAFVGGTRFIGHAAAEWVAGRGHEVTVLHRGRHPCELRGVRDRRVDRHDPQALIGALGEARPEVIVDTYAMTKSDAEVTALAAKVLGVAVVMLSSHDVYAQLGRLNGLPAPEPEAVIDEGSPLTVPYPFRSLGPHEGGPDYDKKDVEAVLEAAAGELPGVTVLRLPPVYGDRDHKRRFGWALDALDEGRSTLPVQGGRFRWTHAHVRDVAHAIGLAIEAPPIGHRVLNVGEATTPTMRARVERLAAAAGHEVAFVEAPSLPERFELLGEMANDVVVSSQRIRGELGFSEITSAEEREADVVCWLRESRLSVS